MTYAVIEPFLYGLIFGSFANVCIHRMPIEESIARGRSHCPHCDALIRWYDNAPVFSYLLLRGRCRACRGPIGIQYPLIELACGGLWALAAIRFDGADFVGAAALLWGLLVVFMTDLRFRIIPNEISLGFTALGVLCSPWVKLAPPVPAMLDAARHISMGEGETIAAIARSLAGLLAGGGVILFVRVAGHAVYRQEAMGMGDVKLMAAAGSWLGVAGVLNALFVGVLIGGGMAILLLVTGRAGRRSYVPFGPALVIGTAVALFESERVTGFFFPALAT